MSVIRGERFTGRWDYDGKPIYDKVFSFSTLGNNSDVSQASGLSGIVVKSLYGIVTSAGGFSFNLPYAIKDATSCISLWYDNNTKNIGIGTGKDRSGDSAIVTIEYKYNS